MKGDLEVNLKVKWWKERGRKRPARLNQVVNQMKDGRKVLITEDGKREKPSESRRRDRVRGRDTHTH